MLYEPDAVLGFPLVTVGREAILELYEQMVAQDLTFVEETPLATLYFGDDLTSPRPRRATRPAPGPRSYDDSPTGRGPKSWIRPDFRG